jgi:hypothetical protein
MKFFAICWIIAFNWTTLAAQHTIGLTAGTVFSLKGLGAQLEGQHTYRQWWTILQFSASRYNVPTRNLLLKEWSTLAPRNTPEGIKAGHVLNPYEGYYVNASIQTGWSILLPKNMQLGVGAGLAFIHVKRGTHLHPGLTFFKDVVIQDPDFNDLVALNVFKKTSFVMAYEELNVIAFPVSLRLTGNHNKPFSFFLQTNATLTLHQLSHFQLTTGCYAKLYQWE